MIKVFSINWKKRELNCSFYRKNGNKLTEVCDKGDRVLERLTKTHEKAKKTKVKLLKMIRRCTCNHLVSFSDCFS